MSFNSIFVITHLVLFAKYICYVAGAKVQRKFQRTALWQWIFALASLIAAFVVGKANGEIPKNHPLLP